MKTENINYEKMKEVEKRLGCTFGDRGIFAEMSLDLAAYEEKTHPIADVEFKFFQGNVDDIKKAVALVDDQWVQYFDNNMPIFCGYHEGQIASFCNVDTNADCMISAPGITVGAIGCVGTVPQYRNLGIGLRMVDLATLYLKNKGCDKAYIHYTHIDKWYEKLGYGTFARFSFKENGNI